MQVFISICGVSELCEYIIIYHFSFILDIYVIFSSNYTK